MKLDFKASALPKSGNIILLIEGSKIEGHLKTFNKDGRIANAIKAASHFKGKFGNVLRIIAPNSAIESLFLVSMGDVKDLTEVEAQSLGGKIAVAMNSLEVKKVSVVLEKIKGLKISDDDFASNLAKGVLLRNYKYTKYFVDKKKDNQLYLEDITICADVSKAFKNNFAKTEAIVGGVFLARDLVSMPPNILYPKSFADECKKLSKLGIKVTVLGEKEMLKLGMNALVGVGLGSAKESHLVIMEWKGNKKNSKEAPIAFIGKGVTFDTGGISIKPSAGMGDMKYDMAGAGAVTGLMYTLAKRKANVNAIGVIGLAENMPSGSAQRPADVVTSMSGQTIEIDNTDAEGRLVLADALWYTQSKYKPKFMVNLATLTGAIVMALGENCYAGLFSNNDKLSANLLAAADKSGEGLWRMPLKDYYDKQINSEIADVRNTGNGKGGGAITAAQFLQRFANKLPWAHLDIAGMAWDKQGTDTNPKGATGFGIRLLNRLVEDHYE